MPKKAKCKGYICCPPQTTTFYSRQVEYEYKQLLATESSLDRHKKIDFVCTGWWWQSNLNVRTPKIFPFFPTPDCLLFLEQRVLLLLYVPCIQIIQQQSCTSKWPLQVPVSLFLLFHWSPVLEGRGWWYWWWLVLVLSFPSPKNIPTFIPKVCKPRLVVSFFR